MNDKKTAIQNLNFFLSSLTDELRADGDLDQLVKLLRIVKGVLHSYRTVNLPKCTKIPALFVGNLESIISYKQQEGIKIDKNNETQILSEILTEYTRELSLTRIILENCTSGPTVKEVFYNLHSYTRNSVVSGVLSDSFPNILVGPGYIEDINTGEILACICMNIEQIFKVCKKYDKEYIEKRESNVINIERKGLSLQVNQALLTEEKYKKIKNFVERELVGTFLAAGCEVSYVNSENLAEMFYNWHTENLTIPDIENFTETVYNHILPEDKKIQVTDMLLYGIV